MKTPLIITAAALCGTLCLAPIVKAQPNNNNSTTGSTANRNSASQRTVVAQPEPERQEGPNLGWLGLLGLAGLAGLMKKPQRDVIRQTEIHTTPTTTVTPGSSNTPNVRQ